MRTKGTFVGTNSPSSIPYFLAPSVWASLMKNLAGWELPGGKEEENQKVLNYLEKAEAIDR